MNVLRRWWRSFRSAITGQYVSEADARANPTTTYGERHERSGGHDNLIVRPPGTKPPPDDLAK